MTNELSYAAELLLLRLKEKPSAWMNSKQKKKLRERLLRETARIAGELANPTKD
jgi:hypothetical protein